jgi:ribosomal protein S18 acetylase RimI-like enzyme
MVELQLREVTKDEFERWLPAQQAGYAAQIAESGALSPQAAQQKAIADTTRRLPDGIDSAGQLIFRLMAGDEPVGWLWLEAPIFGGGNPHMAWVNDIEVDEACRGRGYGRQAMLLAEQAARNRGMTSIGLNVHGRNTVARTLYDSLGYEVMSQQMKKPL